VLKKSKLRGKTSHREPQEMTKRKESKKNRRSKRTELSREKGRTTLRGGGRQASFEIKATWGGRAASQTIEKRTSRRN